MNPREREMIGLIPDESFRRLVERLVLTHEWSEWATVAIPRLSGRKCSLELDPWKRWASRKVQSIYHRIAAKKFAKGAVPSTDIRSRMDWNQWSGVEAGRVNSRARREESSEWAKWAERSASRVRYDQGKA